MDAKRIVTYRDIVNRALDTIKEEAPDSVCISIIITTVVQPTIAVTGSSEGAYGKNEITLTCKESNK